jgi:ABC-2 type transport system ATP-binding protein
MQQSPCIQIEHLRKAYGSVIAIEDLSFEVARGEIFGMVGPNGAGKTTTVECLEGLRSPSGGQIRVLGLDPRRNKYALQPRIGVQLQQSALPACRAGGTCFHLRDDRAISEEELRSKGRYYRFCC